MAPEQLHLGRVYARLRSVLGGALSCYLLTPTGWAAAQPRSRRARLFDFIQDADLRAVARARRSCKLDPPSSTRTAASYRSALTARQPALGTRESPHLRPNSVFGHLAPLTEDESRGRLYGTRSRISRVLTQHARCNRSSVITCGRRAPARPRSMLARGPGLRAPRTTARRAHWYLLRFRPRVPPRSLPPPILFICSLNIYYPAAAPFPSFSSSYHPHLSTNAPRRPPASFSARGPRSLARITTHPSGHRHRGGKLRLSSPVRGRARLLGFVALAVLASRPWPPTPTLVVRACHPGTTWRASSKLPLRPSSPASR